MVIRYSSAEESSQGFAASNLMDTSLRNWRKLKIAVDARIVEPLGFVLRGRELRSTEGLEVWRDL
jgi:hypothetical protein